MAIGGERDEKDMNYQEGDGMISKIHPDEVWIPDDPRFTKVPHKTTCLKVIESVGQFCDVV